jgi:hypothetical protein
MFDDKPSGFNVETIGDDCPGGHGILHGMPGVGKSTIGAVASGAINLPGSNERDPFGIVLDCEDGTRHYRKTRRIVPGSADQLFEAFHKFAESKDPSHKVLFVDTLSQFSVNMVFPQICRQHGVQTLADVPFGKGQAATEPFARRYCDGADYIASRGKWLITVVHSKTTTVNDPAVGQPYDRQGLKLPAPMESILVERADWVGYAFRMVVTRNNTGGRTIAIGAGGGGGDRLVQFSGSPSVLAKSRLGHPEEPLPLVWGSFGVSV